MAKEKVVGNVRVPRKQPFKIEPTRRGRDGLIAWADVDGRRVLVNLDHPFIAMIWKKNVDAVIALVVSTWCSESTHEYENAQEYLSETLKEIARNKAAWDAFSSN